MAQEKDESRRGFLKQTATVLTTTVSAQTLAAAPQTATAPKPLDLVAALGDVIIPTDGAMYPGYKRLEANGISARVLDQLRHLDRVTPADLSLLNESARSFTGRTFLESDAEGRVSYLETLFLPVESVQTKLDAGTIRSLQRILKLARDRILTVFRFTPACASDCTIISRRRIPVRPAEGVSFIAFHPALPAGHRLSAGGKSSRVDPG
jgi:hypothetical protein